MALCCVEDLIGIVLWMVLKMVLRMVFMALDCTLPKCPEQSIDFYCCEV